MTSYKNYRPCSAPWDGFAVYANGNVYPCCRLLGVDQLRLGNFKEQTLHEILNGEKAWALRDAWINGTIDQFPCGDCYKEWQNYCLLYFRSNVKEEYFNKAYKKVGERYELVDKRIFPIKRVEMQMSHICQLSCSFCDRENVPLGFEFMNEKNYFNIEMLKQMLDEVEGFGGYGASLYTHGNAEPLTHPQRIEAYREIGGRTFFYSNIQTNGINLTHNFIDEIIPLPGITTVHLSVHAHSRTSYQQVTGVDAFNTLLDNIEYLIKKRSEVGRQKELQVTIALTIADENIEILERSILFFYDLFEKNGDKVTIAFNDVGYWSSSRIAVLADMTDMFSSNAYQAFLIVEELKNEREYDLGNLDEDLYKMQLNRCELYEHLTKINERISLCLKFNGYNHSRNVKDYEYYAGLVNVYKAFLEIKADGILLDQTKKSVNIYIKKYKRKLKRHVKKLFLLLSKDEQEVFKELFKVWFGIKWML